VNQQNAGLATMDTDQILDLFNLGDTGPNLISDKPSGGVDGREEDMIDVETGDVRAPGKKAWVEDLGELWDNRQYEESFDLDGFMKTMQ
jgi:TATA-binding protein-associated factor